MTCVATNEPILAIGAKIVWADIDPWDANIDPDDVEKKITQKTKAIICVHWGGYPCDLERLNEIAGKYNVKLIEDACHAFGASYENRPIGSWSDFTCFSFQAIKQITTIDGGALVCKSSSDHARGKLLRWYGIDRQDKGKDMRCETDIFEYGYKLHMNDVTAAMGLEQLKYVEDIISKHREHAAFYNETFKDLKNVHLLKYKNDRISSFWLYSLRVKNRPRFIEYMNGLGIAASQVHVRNDNHTVFRDFKIKLPGVDEFAEEQVSIPVGWWLNKKDLDRIVRAVSGYDRIIS